MNPDSHIPSAQAHVNDYIAVLSPFQQSLVLPLRQHILAAHAGLSENMRWSSLAFFLNGEAIAVLHTAVDFVSVVFPKGELLQDPEGLLNGEDGSSRSLSFTDPDELDMEKLQDFLKQLLKA